MLYVKYEGFTHKLQKQNSINVYGPKIDAASCDSWHTHSFPKAFCNVEDNFRLNLNQEASVESNLLTLSFCDNSFKTCHEAKVRVNVPNTDRYQKPK